MVATPARYYRFSFTVKSSSNTFAVTQSVMPHSHWVSEWVTHSDSQLVLHLQLQCHSDSLSPWDSDWVSECDCDWVMIELLTHWLGESLTHWIGWMSQSLTSLSQNPVNEYDIDYEYQCQ